MNVFVRNRCKLILALCLVTFSYLTYANTKSYFLKVCENPSADELITVQQIAKDVNLKYRTTLCKSIYRKIQKKKYIYVDNRIKTLRPLFYLDNLESIRAAFDRNITVLNFSGIQNLKKLKTLHLRGTFNTVTNGNKQAEIIGIESLAYLGKLKSLTLNNLGVKKINFLGSLNKIEQVTINKNRIDNLESRFLPSSLMVLNLRENFIPLVPSMSHLTSLQNLDLSHNTFNDISNLSGLDSLKDIRVSRAASSKDRIMLGGLNVINTFSKLEILYIQGWNIENVEFLSGLEKMLKINLRNNKVKDVTPLSKLKSLKSLDVMRNDITDLTPLIPLVLNNDLDLMGSPNPLRACSPKTVKQMKEGIHCSDSIFSNSWNSIRRLFL